MRVSFWKCIRTSHLWAGWALGGPARNTTVGRTHSKRNGVAITACSSLNPTIPVFPCYLHITVPLFLWLFFLLLLLLADVRKYDMDECQPQSSKYIADSTGYHKTSTLWPNMPQLSRSLFSLGWVCKWEGWMRYSPSLTLKTSMWNVRSLYFPPRMNPMGSKVPHGWRLGMTWGHLISWEFSKLETRKGYFWLLGVSQ